MYLAAEVYRVQCTLYTSLLYSVLYTDASLHCTLSTVLFTLLIALCTLFSALSTILYTLSTVVCTTYNDLSPAFTVYCTLSNVRCTLSTVQCSVSTVHYSVAVRDFGIGPYEGRAASRLFSLLAVIKLNCTDSTVLYSNVP